MGIQDRDYYRNERSVPLARAKHLSVLGTYGNLLFEFAFQSLLAIALTAGAFVLAARILGWFGLISVPWVQGGRLILVYGVIPIEPLVLLFVLAWLLSVVFGKGFARGLACLFVAISTLIIFSPIPVPLVWKVLWWRGPQGEFLQSRVFKEETSLHALNPPVAKADGSLVWLTNGEHARNPTGNQLRTFLLSDDTDSREYLEGQFVCADFAEMLHNRAEAAGMRCAYVLIVFQVGEGHAMNAFQTIDEGLVFVDCTGSNGQDGPRSKDALVAVAAGLPYIPKYLVDDGWTVESMGIVEDFELHW